MREILFRGKRVVNGKWVYGSYISHLKRIDNIGALKALSVIPETVGQYTGLKDKTGKEIYEGDILNIYQHGRVVVEFAEGCYGAWDHYGFSPFRGTLFGCGGEIIGNIHENPELLEVSR